MSLSCGILIAGLLPSVAAGLPNGSGGEWAAKFANHGVAASPQVSAPSENDAPHGIEGTWRVLGSFASGGSDVALFTFGAGAKDDQGVVTHSDNLFFVPAPSCLPTQGVWKKDKGDKTFIATDEGFCFDSTNNFAPAGSIRFRTSITVNDKWTQFSGHLIVEGLDTFGTVVFSDVATVQGTRMQAVSPP